MMKWQWEGGRFESNGCGTFELHAIKTLPRAELQGGFLVLLGSQPLPAGMAQSLLIVL